MDLQDADGSPRVSFTDVFVPEDALFGAIGRGLSQAQCFVHENRIRQAAASLGAAVYCITQDYRAMTSVKRSIEAVTAAREAN